MLNITNVQLKCQKMQWNILRKGNNDIISHQWPNIEGNIIPLKLAVFGSKIQAI